VFGDGYSKLMSGERSMVVAKLWVTLAHLGLADDYISGLIQAVPDLMSNVEAQERFATYMMLVTLERLGLADLMK